MREIKFRAWDKRDKQIKEIYLIDWRTSKDYQMIQMPDPEFRSGQEAWGNTQEHIILMQFTGLKDKNGKEIYEGDIAKDSLGQVYEMVFHEKEARFSLKEIPSSINFANYRHVIDVRFMEVIGNKYENPELLEEGSV